MSIIFFGSFQHYSALILQALLESDVAIGAVVTTSVDNEVAALAKNHHLPLLTPKNLDEENLTQLKNLVPPTKQLWLTAGYGKLLPASWLIVPKLGALNLHFSLLPKYRGANPAEWAILNQESETGITLIEMSPKFDQGKIFAQAKIAIAANDNRLTLYQKLYELGAAKINRWLKIWLAKKFGPAEISDPSEQIFWPTKTQDSKSPTPYATRFRRDDGFITWQSLKNSLEGQTFDLELLSPLLQKALKNSPGDAVTIAVACRALIGFPNLWTKVLTIKGEKRLKILAASVQPSTASAPRLILSQVQLEGQKPATFNQIKNSLLI